MMLLKFIYIQIVYHLTILITSKNNLRLDKINSYKGKIHNIDRAPDEVPKINIHMEEPDLDPLDVKTAEEERRVERIRFRDMELMLEEDKEYFQKIVTLQNAQIEELTEVSDTITKLLNKLIVPMSQKPGAGAYPSPGGRNPAYEPTAF